MQPPDQPREIRPWAVALVVVALTAGGVWLILSRGSKDSASPAPTHSPCQPVSTSLPSGAAQTTRTDDWDVEVTGARAAPSVPARGGGTYSAAPGEVFVLVEVRFRSLHPGSESSLSSELASLKCSDGTVRTIAGFDDGRGFCRVCQEELGTDQRQVRWAFIFRMERDFLPQALRFTYGSAGPIPLSLSA